MARPDNWRDLVREHGWGTAPARLLSYSRKSDDHEGCVEWTGPLQAHNSTGQIRISVAGCAWTENVQRLAWAVAHGTPAPADREVQRICCNARCLIHLRLARSGDATVCAYRRQLTAAYKAGLARRSLSDDQVAEVRELLALGVKQKDIQARFGVSPVVVWSIKTGRSYGKAPGETIAQRKIRRGRSPMRLGYMKRTTIRVLAARGWTYPRIAARYKISAQVVRQIVHRHCSYERDPISQREVA